jgi:lipoprotein-anchoring transpeptidase ErfK/SrfK
MQRIALSTLLTLFTVTTAAAGPLNLNSGSYPDGAAPAPAGILSSILAGPAPAAELTPAVRLAQGPAMGGGFLEKLFGESGGPQAPPPSYAPAPMPQYEPAPGYETQPARPAVGPRFMKQEVSYDGKERPGTVVINTQERLLYLVQENGRAIRYGIGVGKPGFTWAGTRQITQKREWPDWTPPSEMLKRRPDLPRHMAGGIDNPLGARAMYLGSSLYRIHGSNEPWTIGTAVSSGCIRMRNEDVVDLYTKVKVGTKVVVI